MLKKYIDDFLMKTKERIILDRIKEELELIKEMELEEDIEVLKDLTSHMEENKIPYIPTSTTSNFYILFILGITNINPLPAHYYCTSCNEFIWSEAEDGFDLEKRKCKCGKEMKRDGHNLGLEVKKRFSKPVEKIKRLTIRCEEKDFDSIAKFLEEHKLLKAVNHSKKEELYSVRNISIDTTNEFTRGKTINSDIDISDLKKFVELQMCKNEKYIKKYYNEIVKDRDIENIKFSELIRIQALVNGTWGYGRDKIFDEFLKLDKELNNVTIFCDDTLKYEDDLLEKWNQEIRQLFPKGHIIEKNLYYYKGI